MATARDWVIERENTRCAFCGHRKGLTAHHALTRNSHREVITDTRFQICLCSDCHNDHINTRWATGLVFITLAGRYDYLYGEAFDCYFEEAERWLLAQIEHESVVLVPSKEVWEYARKLCKRDVEFAIVPFAHIK